MKKADFQNSYIGLPLFHHPVLQCIIILASLEMITNYLYIELKGIKPTSTVRKVVLGNTGENEPPRKARAPLFLDWLPVSARVRGRLPASADRHIATPFRPALANSQHMYQSPLLAHVLIQKYSEGENLAGDQDQNVRIRLSHLG
jgi:hypothetical protein